jgi:3-isopropylmalate/(R)-2-methylmalate dehydratase small subunit
MVLYGTTHRVGDGVTTDMILAPEHRDANDPAELAAQCLAPLDPAIAERVREGDVLLAGRDFGAGDNPDSAALALQAAGFVAIICVSAEPSFVETAHQYGLPVLFCSEAAESIAAGHVIRLDLERGSVQDQVTGIAYCAPPAPPDVAAAVRRAQLLMRMRRVVEDEEYDG